LAEKVWWYGNAIEGKGEPEGGRQERGNFWGEPKEGEMAVKIKKSVRRDPGGREVVHVFGCLWRGGREGGVFIYLLGEEKEKAKRRKTQNFGTVTENAEGEARA